MFKIDEVTQAPVVSNETVYSILRKRYSIQQCNIVPLTGYEDMNFRVENVITERNDLRRASKFILKITNPIEASNKHLLDSQIKLCELLRDYGIPCAITYENNELKLWSVEEVAHNVQLPVRLLEFLEGVKVEETDYSMGVCQRIGRLLAQFHNATSTFDDAAYRMHIPFLSLENRECCKKEMELLFERQLISESHHTLLKRALDSFEAKMSVMFSTMTKGFIHSDFNETNILVEHLLNGEYMVKGLLDFGDAHYSYLIFDIAAAILYMMLGAKAYRYDGEWWKIGSWTISGYEACRPAKDKGILLSSMRARLAHSLIYGLRTARINYRNGDNEYVLKSQSNGWNVLKILCDINDDEYLLKSGITAQSIQQHDQLY